MTIKKHYPSWPFFAEDEVEAVQKVLSSGKVNYWTGQECQLFENEFAQYHGLKHAIALANGTLALELALKALEIQPGDEVIVPARTFLATASAVIAVGGIPVCADVDRDSQGITVQSIQSLINSKTRAIIVVHLAGWPCDMDPIVQCARDNNLRLIEDCAQAHGARYNDQLVGTFSDIATFSFCQDKIMTTGGEGGMLLTNDSTLWESAWSYKDHGKNFQKVQAPHKSIGYQWVHDRFGSNYRMTEMQAAIGRVQLKKLDQWIEQRRKNAALFAQILSKNPVFRIPTPKEDLFCSYYKFYAFLNSDELSSKYSRDELLKKLSDLGIPAFSGICPEIYLENAFIERNLGPKHRLPVAKWLGETSLMFQVHPTLSATDVSDMANTVLDCLKQIELSSQHIEYDQNQGI
jgi:dTDP-4-amino-4,6-dideoxygalactose transaminase